MITIQELLFNRGLDPKSKTKLVRHKEHGLDLYNMYRNKKADFLHYQCIQRNPVFDGVDFLVSFIGEESTSSRFVGVFKVQGIIGKENGKNLYSLLEVDGFEDMRERVIVDWGKSTISWHQWIENTKEIIEIQAGLHYQQFTDYFDFILDFKQLKEIITNQYRDWRRMLRVTKGIYLISDAKTGNLYVGSAYNDEGIWGRWETYVKTNGHGNNKMLKALIDGDPNYGNNFHFSILMLLPQTITPDEAIEKERLFKRKLGTKTFGLNLN